LDVARIGQRKIELHRQPLDMRTIVQQAFEADRHRFEARRQRAVVTPSSEPVIVLGDPVRLQQIVSNLLTNAAKYTPPDGVVTITVAVEDNDAVVRVRDTGIGIPSERLDEIFDLFTQVATKGRSQSGLGIGLALTKQLTELHGGSVAALSEGSGKGSEFIVRLPRLPGAAVEGEPAVPSALAARHRLLIIDDDRDSRDVLAMSLEMDGHRVFAAGSGREGLEIALVERPTAAIVDIGMADIDGYVVARRLRQAMGAEITLIAFSGYGQPEDRRRSLEAGFDAHVVKPATGGGDSLGTRGPRSGRARIKASFERLTAPGDLRPAVLFAASTGSARRRRCRRLAAAVHGVRPAVPGAPRPDRSAAP
jgi:CheY-like chemotaxis protein